MSINSYSFHELKRQCIRNHQRIYMLYRAARVIECVREWSFLSRHRSVWIFVHKIWRRWRRSTNFFPLILLLIESSIFPCFFFFFDFFHDKNDGQLSNATNTGIFTHFSNDSPSIFHWPNAWFMNDWYCDRHSFTTYGCEYSIGMDLFLIIFLHCHSHRNRVAFTRTAVIYTVAHAEWERKIENEICATKRQWVSALQIAIISSLLFCFYFLFTSFFIQLHTLAFDCRLRFYLCNEQDQQICLKYIRLYMNIWKVNNLFRPSATYNFNHIWK